MPSTHTGDDDTDQAPWRRLFHESEEQDEAQQQQEEQQQQDQQQSQQAEEEQPLTELQQQLLTCYRKTFLVAGLGLASSVWRWNTVTKHKRQDIFLPPRAQALPEAVVKSYKQKAEFREALRTIGRQSVFITGVAGLYFGTELGVGLWRDKQSDWANTATAGALAGSLLGARVPSSMRGRTMAMGGVVGGMMGAVSGWAQQQLLALAAERELTVQQQQQEQPPQPPPVGPKQ